jgi:hypothetical protein
VNSTLKIILGTAILIGFIAGVQHYIGWAELLQPWRDAAPDTLFAALTLTFVTYLLRAARLHDYFHTLLRGHFATSLKLTLQHNLLNNLLPMRAGELSFPVLMFRYFGVPAGVSVPALFWFRVMDLHTLLAIALVAAGDLWLAPQRVWPVAAAWMALPVVAFRLHLRGARALGNADTGWKKIVARVLASFPQTSGAFWRAWAWTWVNWVVKLGVFAWVLRMFVEAPWSATWLGSIFGDATSVLPIHGVAGAGTYEAGVVAALIPAGIDAEAALRGAVNLHLFLLGSTLLGGLAALALPGGARAKAET